MLRPRRLHTVNCAPCAALGLVALLAACNATDSTSGPHHGVPAQLVRVSGDSQPGVAGYPLDSAVVLRVVDAFGEPLPGVTVTFAIDPADSTTLHLNGTLTSPSALSDGTGLVRAHWRLGGSLGAQHLKAVLSVASTTTPAALSLTAFGRTNAVLSIDGGRAGICAIDLTGHLGCWQAPIPGLTLGVHMKLATSPVTFTMVAMKEKSEGQVASGCALATTGKPWCFTVDATGNVTGLAQLGGTYPAFARIAGAGSEGAAICALAMDGSAWCWGDNFGGVLGNGTQVAQSTPVQVPTAARFVSLEVTDDEACALTVEGQVWCWGDNYYSQVGAYNPDPGHVVPVSPTLVNTPVRFSQLALYAYGNMACGVATGGVYCWGDVSGFGTTASTVAPDTTSIPRLMVAGSYLGVAWGGGEGYFLFGQGGLVQYSVTGDICPRCILFNMPYTPVLSTILTTQGGGMICGGTTPSPTAAVLCMATDRSDDHVFAGFPSIFGVPFP
jgi:hypothetical protein